MKPTDILREEHDHILIMLKVLDAMSRQVAAGKSIPAEDLAAALDFIRGFADGCHHAKEEKLLFPEMEAAGFPRDAGPLFVMLAEHEKGRAFVREMASSMEAASVGDRDAAKKFRAGAEGYIELLKAHIAKENEVLFRMADERIPADRQKALEEGFERVEKEEIGEGVHEKYHELLHRLRDAYLE